MNSNVKVMIYPYKKDYSELVYYYTEVLNQTIVLISGCFYEEMGPNINMFQNFSQGLENSETVIFTYSSLEEIDYNNIESAVCGKKKIIVSNKIYNFLPTSLSRYVSKTFGYNLSNYKEDPFANLFRMNIPIIGISGMGSNAEKTLTQVIIGFYGGEPLLAFDLIKKIVQYIHSTFPERKVEYSITTNGTLLNNEIIEFFIREKFQMTLSIDGPKEIHDKNRHFQSGRGSFDVIVQKLTKLEQTFPKFFENVTTNTVINPEYNVNNYIDFFNDNVSLKNMHHRLSGLSDAGIDDIYVYNEDLKIAMAKEEIYAMANMLGWFAKDFELKEYFPPYMSDLIQKHAILESGEFISKSGHPGGPCIPGVKRCLVNIDGDIFPCEKAIENQEMVIGNTEQGFYLEKVKQFMNIGTLTENECKNCWAFLLCSSCGVSCTGSDGFCAKKRLKKCGGIQQYVIKILKSIKILEENGYDFYRFEKNVEE